MNASDSPVRPPTLAAWCVELFASPNEADGILGDLEEEFSALTARAGGAEARRDYRRQAWRTIRDLALSPWHRSSLSQGQISASGILIALGIGVVGLAASWPVGWALNAGARELVVRYPIYDYIPAALFWTALSYLGPFTTGLAIALGSRATRLRPMGVAVSIVAVIAIALAVDRPVMLTLYGQPRGVPITFAGTVVRWLYGVVTFGGVLLVGAAVGRKLWFPRRAVRRRTLRPS